MFLGEPESVANMLDKLISGSKVCPTFFTFPSAKQDSFLSLLIAIVLET
jgi:hypothetical protein